MNKKLQKLMGISVVGGKVYATARKGALIEDVRKEFALLGPTKTKQAILQDIATGISPVQGKGKLQKYSDGYIDQIEKGKFKNTIGTKRISPVNLRLSGDLTRSLKAYAAGVGRNFRLVLSWEHFLAVIHNTRGAGKSKVIRRMLPTQKGEKFNRRITQVILSELKKATLKVVKRIS